MDNTLAQWIQGMEKDINVDEGKHFSSIIGVIGLTKGQTKMRVLEIKKMLL